MTTHGQILSIQVGKIQTFHGDAADSWTSAICKTKVSHAVHVDRTGITGDEQADVVNHGGPDKAVLAYASKHYEIWNSECPDMNFEAGGFGENLTIADIDESSCCIGDTFRIGDCLLQISQPRQPCWKLSGRWKMPKLAVLVQQNGRTGWYYRVLKEGVSLGGSAAESISPSTISLFDHGSCFRQHWTKRSVTIFDFDVDSYPETDAYDFNQIQKDEWFEKEIKTGIDRKGKAATLRKSKSDSRTTG